MWPSQAAPKVLIITPTDLVALSPAATTTKVLGFSASTFASSSFTGATNLPMPPAISPFSSTLNQ